MCLLNSADFGLVPSTAKPNKTTIKLEKFSIVRKVKNYQGIKIYSCANISMYKVHQISNEINHNPQFILS